MAILFVVLCCVICLATINWAFNFAQNQTKKIYVLDQGRSFLLALAQDYNINRPVEAKDHVRRFHELFFNISPDQESIDSNMKQAFNMADKSAYDKYKTLVDSKYFTKLMARGAIQKINIDSIHLNTNVKPYYAKTFATELIIRPTDVTTQSLITECYLSEIPRTENNPHGFLIERWEILENKPLKTITRN